MSWLSRMWDKVTDIKNRLDAEIAEKISPSSVTKTLSS